MRKRHRDKETFAAMRERHPQAKNIKMMVRAYRERAEADGSEYRYLREEAECEEYGSPNGYHIDSQYIAYIDGCLRLMRAGVPVFITELSQLYELLRFEPRADVDYLPATKEYQIVCGGAD